MIYRLKVNIASRVDMGKVTQNQAPIRLHLGNLFHLFQCDSGPRTQCGQLRVPHVGQVAIIHLLRGEAVHLRSGLDDKPELHRYFSATNFLCVCARVKNRKVV